MRWLKIILTCCWLLACPDCLLVWGDGGRVVLIERQGDTRITIFSSPNPLRAGPIDISVLLQDAVTGQPIADALVNVRIVSHDQPDTVIHANATEDAATNKLLRAALVELPESGWWDVEVDCSVKDKKPIHVDVTVEAGQRLPQWLTVWPWFTWPFGVVALFCIHRAIVARKQNLSYESID